MGRESALGRVVGILLRYPLDENRKSQSSPPGNLDDSGAKRIQVDLENLRPYAEFTQAGTENYLYAAIYLFFFEKDNNGHVIRTKSWRR
jgi:hypothetical protein